MMHPSTGCAREGKRQCWALERQSMVVECFFCCCCCLKELWRGYPGTSVDTADTPTPTPHPVQRLHPRCSPGFNSTPFHLLRVIPLLSIPHFLSKASAVLSTKAQKTPKHVLKKKHPFSLCSTKSTVCPWGLQCTNFGRSVVVVVMMS